MTNTSSLKSFLAGEYRDQEKTELLDQQEYIKERFLVGLRVMEGVAFPTLSPFASSGNKAPSSLGRSSGEGGPHGTVVDFTSLLVPNRKEKVDLYVGEGLCLRDDETQRLSLTDSGMDVYNSIVSELVMEL